MARLSAILEQPSPDTTSRASDDIRNYIQRDFVQNANYEFHWGHERTEVISTQISEFSRLHRICNEEHGRYRHLDMVSTLSSCVTSMISFDKSQLGDILLNCYQIGPLKQRTNLEAHTEYVRDILAIVGVLMINDELSSLDIASYYFKIGYIFKERPVNILLGMDIIDLFQIIHLSFFKPLVLEGSNGSTFAIDDLNINTLESIGGLSIKWTESFEDHLRLDMVNKTLFITWSLIAQGPMSAVANYKLGRVYINTIICVILTKV